MTIKRTPQERLSAAEWEIRDYDSRIRYHDSEASRLRKQREKYKGRRDRALAAMEREINTASWNSRSTK